MLLPDDGLGDGIVLLVAGVPRQLFLRSILHGTAGCIGYPSLDDGRLA